MQEVSVQNQANQQITFSNNGNTYVIDFRSFGSNADETMLFATVKLNGEYAAVSQRCVPNGWLIPQPYLTDDCGNLRFECDDEDYPYFENFGVTCRLRFYTDEEYKAIIAESA